jgi:hypothetical protein
MSMINELSFVDITNIQILFTTCINKNAFHENELEQGSKIYTIINDYITSYKQNTTIQINLTMNDIQFIYDTIKQRCRRVPFEFKYLKNIGNLEKKITLILDI